MLLTVPPGCRWCDTITVKDCLLNTVSSFNCECDTPMEFMAGGDSSHIFGDYCSN